MRVDDKQASLRWEMFKKELRRQTTIPKETAEQKRKRIAKLEGNPELWFKYYFPNFYKADPAPFHTRSTKEVVNSTKLFLVRAWSREMAKDVRTMFEVFYLVFAKKEAKNILLVSHSSDNAKKLLKPFQINLESNRRLINDYGLQRNFNNWSTGEFVTLDGVGFLAVGAGQSPRGTRVEADRPDIIIVTDIDEDELVRNQERVNDRYKWFERALIPTVSVSAGWRIIWCNNIIGKHTCTTEAMKVATKVEVVNIRNKHGKSNWPAKNSEEDIEALLSVMSYNSAQQEYFNNPITEGSVFKEMTYGVVPRNFDFIINYGDPSPSNSESKKSSFKIIVQMGYKDSIYYIIDCFVKQCGSAQFVEAFYALNESHKGTPQYNYIENNSLQNPVYEQVYVPIFIAENKRRGLSLMPTADTRKKPDKFFRIESNLEPINRTKMLVLNARKKDDKHMQRLEQQFLNVEPKLSAHADAPDAVEGGKYIIDEIRRSIAPDAVKVFNPKKQKRNGLRR